MLGGVIVLTLLVVGAVFWWGSRRQQIPQWLEDENDEPAGPGLSVTLTVSYNSADPTEWPEPSGSGDLNHLPTIEEPTQRFNPAVKYYVVRTAGTKLHLSRAIPGTDEHPDYFCHYARDSFSIEVVETRSSAAVSCSLCKKALESLRSKTESLALSIEAQRAWKRAVPHLARKGSGKTHLIMQIPGANMVLTEVRPLCGRAMKFDTCAPVAESEVSELVSCATCHAELRQVEERRPYLRGKHFEQLVEALRTKSEAGER